MKKYLVPEMMKKECEKILSREWIGTEELIKTYDYICLNWNDLERPFRDDPKKDLEYYDFLFSIYQEFEVYIQEAPTLKGREVDENKYKSSYQFYVCFACLLMLDYDANKKFLDDFIKDIQKKEELSKDIIKSIVGMKIKNKKLNHLS